jgi:peroxiredoxin
MRLVLTGALAAILFSGASSAEEPKQAPKVTLQSPDGKKSYDLAKLLEKGPVLVRLTCACSGCDKELPFFQKLQAAYNTKGLQTIAVFREKAESLDSYAVKKDIRFMWLADPKGDLWKTFDAKTMPTNILIDKGGRVVSIVPGCTIDGKNAQALSADVARILQTPVAKIAEPKNTK